MDSSRENEQKTLFATSWSALFAKPERKETSTSFELASTDDEQCSSKRMSLEELGPGGITFWRVGAAIPPTVTGQSSGNDIATGKTSTPRANDARNTYFFKGKKTRREELRHANFFLRKYDESIATGRELTIKDLEHREWALDIIKKYETLDNKESSSSGSVMKKHSSDGAGKRSWSPDASRRGDEKKQRRDIPTSSRRHEEKRVEANHSKPSGSKKNDQGRVRFIDQMPLSELLKQDLKVVIVDKNETDLRINPDNYSRVEKGILKELFEWIKSHPSRVAPVFSSQERFRGYKVVSCDSQGSVEFLKAAVGRMASPWRNAKLEVRYLRELPGMPKAYVNIPLSVDDKQVDREFGEMTLTILKAQNPDIPMGNWTLLRVGKIIRRATLMTFAIDKGSFAALDTKGHTLTFGTENVRVDTSKGGLIIDEVKDREESIIEHRMESARDDEPPSAKRH
ncbi:hypothetical protein ACFFRR_002693 [Megaselia abdita]